MGVCCASNLYLVGVMKRLFIFIICVVAAQRAVAQSTKTGMLSFDEALAITLENNMAVQAAEASVRAAEQERRAAIGLRAPTIAINGAYNWLGDDMAIDFNGIKDVVSKGAEVIIPTLEPGLGQALQGLAAPIFARNWEFVLQKRNLASIGGTISVPIFTGGRINVANRAAQIGKKMADRELQYVRRGLTTQLVERYFGVTLARYAVQVRHQVLEGIVKHLADAIALENNGMIAASERLYVEYKVAEAERELQKAQLEERTAQDALKNTLGGFSADPVTTIFVIDNPEDVSFFVRQALENNTLLQQAQLQEGLARENVRLQRADFFPQVAAMGAASFYNWQVSNILPRWAVGIGATFKIFNGLTREYKYSAAQHTLRGAESMVAKAESDIVLLVENLHSDMINQLSLLQSIDVSIAFAQEYLRSKNVAFAEGICSSTELIDAELNLAKVRIERLETAYRFDMALARLLEASGASEEFANYINRTDARAIIF